MKLPKRWMLYCGVVLFSLYGMVHAETNYVTDSVKLTVRTGQGTDYKIIAVIESGQQVDVLQSGDEWSLVRLPDGKEGWVLSRYLTPEVTNNIKLQRLEEKYKHLMTQSAELVEENNKLKAENTSLSAAATGSEKELSQIRNEYESLKEGSAEFLSLKTQYEKTTAQLAERTQKLEKLEDQVSKLEFYHSIKWFLAGSGVLLLGFIIGFSAKRQRRRSSLL
jgi:SH3 domain protein